MRDAGLIVVQIGTPASASSGPPLSRPQGVVLSAISRTSTPRPLARASASTIPKPVVNPYALARMSLSALSIARIAKRRSPPRARNKPLTRRSRPPRRSTAKATARLMRAITRSRTRADAKTSAISTAREEFARRSCIYSASSIGRPRNQNSTRLGLSPFRPSREPAIGAAPNCVGRLRIAGGRRRRSLWPLPAASRDELRPYGGHNFRSAIRPRRRSGTARRRSEKDVDGPSPACAPAIEIDETAIDAPDIRHIEVSTQPEPSFRGW